jgi:hypothetical protein
MVQLQVQTKKTIDDRIIIAEIELDYIMYRNKILKTNGQFFTIDDIHDSVPKMMLFPLITIITALIKRPWWNRKIDMIRLTSAGKHLMITPYVLDLAPADERFEFTLLFGIIDNLCMKCGSTSGPLITIVTNNNEIERRCKSCGHS